MSSTIAEQIYLSLTDQIISGKLAPGQRIEEQTVATQFGISRTPVRDALRQLAGSGLVEFRPHRGAMVANLDLAQLGEMLEALEELEALCARLAAQRMSAVERKQLELMTHQQTEAVKAKDDALYWKLNDEFHEAIYKGADNRSIHEITENFRRRVMPFRSFLFSLGNRMPTAFGEHQEILQAILTSDTERAYKAMRNHSGNSNVRLINFLRDREQAKAAQPNPKPRPKASRR